MGRRAQRPAHQRLTPPLHKKFQEYYLSWQWIFIVACDNFCRRHLGFSPLLRYCCRHWHPWQPNQILHHRNLCLRGSKVDNSLLSSGEKIKHHQGTYLWLPRNSKNLAHSMVFALTAHHCVNQLKLEAKNTSLLLSPLSFEDWVQLKRYETRVPGQFGHRAARPGSRVHRNSRRKTPASSPNKLFRPLFSYFASIQDDKSLKNGNHCFAEVIEPKSPPNIKWVQCDRDLAEDFRLHLYQGVGIRAAPPCTGVRRVTLISRQPYPESANLRQDPSIRRIDNEEDLLEGLRARFPSMQINLVRMELHSVEAQLALINETDALIGMHGAGMGYATLLPANAAVLEMFPCHFRTKHYFRAFYIASATRNLHYRRWLQLLPWRERASESYALLSSRKRAGKSWRIEEQRYDDRVCPRHRLPASRPGARCGRQRKKSGLPMLKPWTKAPREN